MTAIFGEPRGLYRPSNYGRGGLQHWAISAHLGLNTMSIPIESVFAFLGKSTQGDGKVLSPSIR